MGLALSQGYTIRGRCKPSCTQATQGTLINLRLHIPTTPENKIVASSACVPGASKRAHQKKESESNRPLLEHLHPAQSSTTTSKQRHDYSGSFCSRMQTTESSYAASCSCRTSIHRKPQSQQKPLDTGIRNETKTRCSCKWYFRLRGTFPDRQ